MEREEALGRQAFEVLAQRKRAHRRERRAAAAAAAAHGAEEEEEEEEEEEQEEHQQQQQLGGGHGRGEERLPAAGHHVADAAPMAMQLDYDQAGPSSAAPQKGRRGRRGRKGSSAFGARCAGAWGLGCCVGVQNRHWSCCRMHTCICCQSRCLHRYQRNAYSPSVLTFASPHSVDEIWDDDLAEQMGLQPANSRKKQRNRQRWRWACWGNVTY